MRHIFHPEAEEICVGMTPAAVQIHIENQTGDLFVLEFHEETLDAVLRHLLEAAWRMQIDSPQLQCCQRPRNEHEVPF